MKGLMIPERLSQRRTQMSWESSGLCLSSLPTTEICSLRKSSCLHGLYSANHLTRGSQVMSWFQTVVEGFTEEVNNSEKEKWSFNSFWKPRIPGPSPAFSVAKNMAFVFAPCIWKHSSSCLFMEMWRMIPNCPKGSKALPLPVFL